MKECWVEESSCDNIKNFKRKWNKVKYVREGQPRKKKVEACKECRKNHVGECLKTKGVL